MYKLIFLIEPLKLPVGKKYNLNNVKEIQVSEDFLGLPNEVIGCQNVESEEDCKTRLYMNALINQCKCLPFGVNQIHNQVGISIKHPRSGKVCKKKQSRK